MDILDDIYEGQKTNKSRQFAENFETCDKTGAYLYKTTGCFNRHYQPREYQDNEYNNINRAFVGDMYKDMALTNTVKELLQEGHELDPDETLEQFVERCCYET